MCPLDVLPRLPAIWRRINESRRRRDRLRSRRARHPRQPRIHPPGRQARAPQDAAHPDRRLCLAERLGLAPMAARARCAAYVDHILAILPFEPDAHRQARRPALQLCRPSADREARLDRDAGPGGLAARLGIADERPVLVVLPGSRSSEVKRLMAPVRRGAAAVCSESSAVRSDPAGRGKRARPGRGGAHRPGRSSRISSTARPTNSRPSSSRARRLRPPAP